ncbi:hypothetical protein [Algibacter sp. 2305UL17-15]|uniref:hypothetical protein n=1 Tax=Algibacter sp. 2305UL17-15 TaxID=3231268 RepID=UPI00345791C2
MTNSSTIKPPIWFWIVSVIALIWNAMGISAYLAQAYMTDEMKAALPEAERALYENQPVWYTAVFAIAVFAGALGCLGLILRKKWSYFLLLLSLIAAIIQMSYVTFSLEMANAMTPMIIIVAVLLVWLSKHATKKGWIS